MAKIYFIAKPIYSYSTKILRDHELTCARYPAGVYPTRQVQGMGALSFLDSYVKAPMPVMARPTMSVCMVSVPSKVWIASMSTMCRMTW